MKKILKIAICLLLSVNIAAQTIYVSKQTGQSTSFNGSYTKQTDRFEQGSFNLSTQGPIVYTVDPGSISIGVNENKSWAGLVSADAANAPTPGTQVDASLTATYDLKYSRPYGSGTSGTVLSTYYCGDSTSGTGSGTGGGCTFHGAPGVHEIVQNTGSYTLNFTIISIKVEIADTICLGHTGERAVTAVSFPATGGTFQWSTGDPNVEITDPGSATATIKLLDTTVRNAVVTVLFTINGITYEKQGVLSTCECSCKPIVGGLSVGPLSITGGLPVVAAEPDADGNCRYNVNDAGVALTLKGVIQRSLTLQNDVKVGFGKNCETGALTNVTVDWSGSKKIDPVNILGVKTFELEVKEFHLVVSTAGQLSGTVTVHVSNTEDRDLSLGKKFIMLRKGTNTDITFTYNNENGFNGAFDFSGIQGIKIDIQKPGDGAGMVIIASYTGDMDRNGLLKGDLAVVADATYKTNLFKVTMKELVLGNELDIATATFKLTSGRGKVQLSEMRALTGTIDLALDFPAAGGCTATVDAANITAFTMTLDELHLQANFDKEFNMTQVEGNLKAKHNRFDVKINVEQFKIENGSLKEFSCSGRVAYGPFTFVLERAVYAPVKITIDAKVELTVTGAAAMVHVTGFTVDEDGTITVGSISGNFNKPPASVSFSATFGNNRFTGTFNGSFAAIGLDGAVDIGAMQNPDYNFAYLSVTARANVPLGNSGLKLTQIGGKLGYNYELTGPDDAGAPQQGRYLAGLKLGVADVANMCEVTGEAIVAFGLGSVDITLNGTVAVLKNNKFFEGNATVTYRIPANTLSGRIGARIAIPGNGWMFRSNNLNVNFFFGNGTFTASGNNMGGSMFGGKLQFTNGNFSLNGNTSSPASLTGSLSGRASCSFAYSANVSLGGNSISGSVSFNMNSDVNVGFNENGLSGSFNVHVDGSGSITVDTWLWTQTVSASAAADGSISYSGGTLSLSGNVTITLPFSIPFYGNTISTGNVGISI